MAQMSRSIAGFDSMYGLIGNARVGPRQYGIGGLGRDRERVHDGERLKVMKPINYSR